MVHEKQLHTNKIGEVGSDPSYFLSSAGVKSRLPIDCRLGLGGSKEAKKNMKSLEYEISCIYLPAGLFGARNFFIMSAITAMRKP